MFQREIVIDEVYDEETQRFSPSSVFVLRLEHSLVSLSKWESKFKKPFIGCEKTSDETLEYIRLMSADDIPDDVLNHLTIDDVSAINEYVNDPMTATTFTDRESTPTKKEVITAEIIYYWMTALNIPFECQYWHIGKLLTLIRVCSIKSTPPKKISKSDLAGRNRALNASRRAKLGTRG